MVPGPPPGGYLVRYPPGGVPGPGPDWVPPLGGYPVRYPPGGYPVRYPPGGYPNPPGGTRSGTPPGGYLVRYPPWGVPGPGPDWVPPRGGYPDLDLTGYPPGGVPGPGPDWVPPRGGTRTPPLPHGILGNVAKHYGIWVTPPPPRCGQTNKVKLLPSRRTTYAGGNYLSCILFAPSVHFLNSILVVFSHRSMLITIQIDAMPLFAM